MVYQKGKGAKGTIGKLGQNRYTLLCTDKQGPTTESKVCNNL